MKDNLDSLTIGDHSFESRLFVGTGKFSSGISLARTLDACGTQLVTVAMKRANLKQPDSILPHIDRSKYKLLPNTSGVRNAKEAVWDAAKDTHIPKKKQIFAVAEESRHVV